jgi:2-keto-myo-inositol isomerase
VKIGYNGACTRHTSLEQDVAIAARTGYEFLEIRSDKLEKYLTTNTVDDLREVFRSHRIRPLSINSVEEPFFRSRSEEEVLLKKFGQWVDIAAQIQCPYIVVVPNQGVSDMPDLETIRREAVRMLRILAELAEKSGVKVAFEFLGFRDCMVNTLEQAETIRRETAKDSVGLVVDAFHFHAGGSRLADLHELDPSNLYIFHINDAENRPKDSLTDAHRLFPGLGVIPLREMLHALREIGYDGPVSVELFRPEYWEMEPKQVINNALTHTREVIASLEDPTH